MADKTLKEEVEWTGKFQRVVQKNRQKWGIVVAI